jgi:hypothetical protein
MNSETQEREITLGNAFRLAKFYGVPLEIIWRPLWDRICHEVAPAPKPKLS